MLALLSAIFAASLLGSTHCVGMCGAFVAFAVGSASTPGARSRWSLTAAYNLGRLGTYLALGSVAGALGAGLNLGASLVGVQRFAEIAAALMIGGFGVVAILRRIGVSIPRLPLPPALVRWAKAGHEFAFNRPPVVRAALVGLLTTLLPCGWLYAFVITAAGTAHPLWGAAAMLAFWMGTLPVMGALGLGVQSLAGPFRRHLPLATSLLLVAVSLWTIFVRLATPALAAPHSAASSVTVPQSPEAACPLCNPGAK